MAIFVCEFCGYEKTVPDQYIGRRLKCSKCKRSSSVIADSDEKANTPEQTAGEKSDSAAPRAAHFKCHHCGAVHPLASSQVDRAVRCRQCGWSSVGMEGEGPPPAYAPTFEIVKSVNVVILLLVLILVSQIPQCCVMIGCQPP